MTDPIAPELMTMPEDVMRIIMGECDFVSIQRLRSTCHAFRNFIDANPNIPKYHFKYIQITGDQKEMSLLLEEKKLYIEQLYPKGQTIFMEYYNIDEKSTAIIWKRNRKNIKKIIENFNFFDLFSRDLESILDRNSTTFESMLIAFDENRHGSAQKVLETCGKPPIKVRWLTIENVTCQEYFGGILRYICPDTLKSLHMDCERGGCDISKIVQMDQWKNLKELHIRKMSVRAGIQNFMHFEKAQFHFEEITMDDVIRVKEHFLNSPPTKKSLQIEFDRFNDEGRLIELFGRPYRNPYFACSEWYFWRPDNKVVFIEFTDSSFACEIQYRACVPRGARLIG
ncbi:unnamed protein product [Caenorhabditis brenneri]